MLRSKVALERRAGELSPGHLPDGLVGVLVTSDGSVVVDDGSLEHPAKEASWSRGGVRRLSEQCALLSGSVLSPVLVHTPHTSTHIPTTVRRELLVSDDELAAELAAMTDSGVAAVASALTTRSNTVRPAPTVAAATMSRLVFDPERFPKGDGMEAVGMGLVYTRRADGTPLRELLPSARLAWYQEQHRAYTESLERLVEDLLARFGGAVILDLHSYPAEPLGYEAPDRHRPEVCIGTDPFHTPAWLENAAVAVFASGFEVGVNTPFSGTYVPGRFYQSDPRVASLMIEVRRDLLLIAKGVDAVTEAVSRIVREATARLTGHEERR